MNPRPKAYESSALPLSYSGIALYLQAVLDSSWGGCLTLCWRGFVKGPQTPGTALKLSRAPRQHRRGNYSKVFDQRKRRVRALCERNGAYYAQITVADETTGKKTVRRTRLEDGDGNPVGIVADATMAMNKLKVQMDENALKLSPKRKGHRRKPATDGGRFVAERNRWRPFTAPSGSAILFVNLAHVHVCASLPRIFSLRR